MISKFFPPQVVHAMLLAEKMISFKCSPLGVKTMMRYDAKTAIQRLPSVLPTRSVLISSHQESYRSLTYSTTIPSGSPNDSLRSINSLRFEISPDSRSKSYANTIMATESLKYTINQISKLQSRCLGSVPTGLVVRAPSQTIATDNSLFHLMQTSIWIIPP